MDKFVWQLTETLFLKNPLFWLFIVIVIIAALFYKKIVGFMGELWTKEALFKLNNDEYKFYVNDSTCNSNINVTNEKTVMPVTSKQNSMYLVSFIILFA